MVKQIKDTVSDLVSDFLYYDRKEDEELPLGAIEKAIEDGLISKEEIIKEFEKHLTEAIG